MVDIYRDVVYPPILVLPNKRFVLVVEGGGGGFSSWDAVGARDWRME